MTVDDEKDLTRLDAFLQNLLREFSELPVEEEQHQERSKISGIVYKQQSELAEPDWVPGVGMKRLIEIYEGADVESIPYWRTMEDHLGGPIIFKIDSKTKKGFVNVCVYAYGNEVDLKVRALVAYTNWQMNQGC